jgi:hypothetical protein
MVADGMSDLCRPCFGSRMKYLRQCYQEYGKEAADAAA